MVQLPNMGSCLLFMVVAHAMIIVTSAQSLEVGYYRETCPTAEAVVRRTVYDAMVQDPGMGPGLVRLHFHDCFVSGCDGSVLVDSTPGNPAEKDAIPLRGFEVIDQAKAALEDLCPQTVSCADVLAFAARDAAFFSNGIDYAAESGRLDGSLSLLTDVIPGPNLPPPSDNADQLIASFAAKGLSLDDMVTLSGAHSFGIANCSSFSNRLYSFSDTFPQDPSMDPAFAEYLMTICPPPTSTGSIPTVNQDDVTPLVLDNQYYRNLMDRRGLFTSDQTLLENSLTAPLVADYAISPTFWTQKFTSAMVRMGAVEVLTGSRGGIRTDCRVVN